MSKVMVAIGQYLNKKRPEPSLAIMNPDISDEEMEALGFRKKNEFWVISRAKAYEIFETDSFDFDKHWDQEEKSRRNAIPG